MKNIWITMLIISCVLPALSGCSLPQAAQSTPPMTVVIPPSSTPPPASATPVVPTIVPGIPTLIPITATSPSTGVTSPTQAPSIIPGSPSGPYAVVLVKPNDVLNIRSGPGTNNAIVGSFSPTLTNVQCTGSSSTADGAIWLEVNNPSGGNGWVNASFLTDYVPQTETCDPRVMTLLANLEKAITTSDGVLLTSLVSPKHGVDVWAYRSGHPINFDIEHIRWVFESTYVHNWGDHPASGLSVTGAFHQVVLPMMMDVYGHSYEIRCNERGVPGWNFSAWPEEYTNYNVYKLYKPGTSGVDLDWRVWLVGVEYTHGQPYLTALINFEWVP